MADIVDKIMAKCESDPTIHAKSLNLVIASKGFLKKRRILNANGNTSFVFLPTSFLRTTTSGLNRLYWLVPLAIPLR